MSYDLYNFEEYDLVNLVSFRNLLRLVKFGLLHKYTQKNTLYKAEENLGRKISLFLRVGLLKPLKS